KTGVDGAGYLSSAQALRDHGLAAIAGLPIEHSPTYPLVLWLGLLLPVDVSWFVVIVQAVVGAATVLVLVRLTLRETGDRHAARAAGVIAAIQITFVFWTTYLLSETVFLFLIAVTADRTLVLKSSRHLLRDATLVGVLALLSISVRPTGVAFMVALLITIIAIGRQGLVTRLAGFLVPTVVISVLVFSSAAIGHNSQSTGLVERVGDWARSAVKNGLLETEQGRATSGVDLDLAEPPILETLPADQRQEFVQSGPLVFAVHHPSFVLEQTARKFKIFWEPATPDYSRAHALGSTAYFLIFYALAVVGAIYGIRYRLLFVVCVASVAMFTLTSLATIVDYDQRYRLPAELFLVPLAGIGLAFVGRWRNHRIASTAPARPERELAGSGEVRG
ncbi:MAG: glycosyltransferase family 39 protein, partial [Chloroflexi bacterium]|nr:glycosyltransferase family 39 protein [Chloroflexota bacterium]